MPVYMPNWGIKIRCDCMSRRECSFPIRDKTWLILFCRKMTLTTTRILANSEEKLMAETNQLLCKSDMMPKSNDSEDENKCDAAMLGRIYRPEGLLFKNVPHVSFSLFNIFWYRCILCMEKAYSIRLSKLKAKWPFLFFPPQY